MKNECDIAHQTSRDYYTLLVYLVREGYYAEKDKKRMELH